MEKEEQTEKKNSVEPKEEVVKAIIQDYINNIDGEGSIPRLSEKYKLSTWKIYEILAKRGITRNLSLSKLQNKEGWRKLIGVGKGKSAKIVSIAYIYLAPLGYQRGEDLEGKWIIENDRLILLTRRAKKE